MSRENTFDGLYRKLIVRRDGLRRALDGGLAVLAQPRVSIHSNFADEAPEEDSARITVGLAEVNGGELALINRALERMRDGNYGVCQKCGANIPIVRLKALPHAEFCIKCQQEAERRRAVAAPIWREALCPGFAAASMSEQDELIGLVN